MKQPKSRPSRQAVWKFFEKRAIDGGAGVAVVGRAEEGLESDEKDPTANLAAGRTR
jgi:hypothetical protein